MEEAPSPLEDKQFVSVFEQIIKYNEKEYKIELYSSHEEMKIIINEENDSLSNKIYSNIFSLMQLYNISNYFKMFDKIDDLITNIKNLIEENKFQLSINDKTLIIIFSPGIIIKGKIELTLLLKEKTQSEKLNDLITLTQSLLKRVDKLEKENTNLKEEVKELKEKLKTNININQEDKDPFSDSLILKDKNDKNTMLTLLDKKIKNTTLLYRATRDGDTAKNFHEKCDYKGPTLTLCRGENGIIFGGYTEAEWDSRERHPKYDKNAFIFSVTFNKKFLSINYENSIECNPDYGPVFGFEGDLYISNKFLSKKNLNVSAFEKTYKDNKHEILNGKTDITLDELEVYLINK